jgi:polar amino acid transport system substrate-binding protein
VRITKKCLTFVRAGIGLSLVTWASVSGFAALATTTTEPTALSTDRQADPGAAAASTSQSPSLPAPSAQPITPSLQPITLPVARKLRVSTKPLTPFVIKSGVNDEKLEGFSIDLWSEICRRNAWQFDWQMRSNVGEVLSDVQNGLADVGIAGISMTATREDLLDFSHPMFAAGLQIATAKTSTGLSSVLRSVFSPSLIRLIIAFVAFMLVGGHVIWLVERKRDPKFATEYGKGVGQGIWQAGSTLLSAGYGDRPPDKIKGRIAALCWMLTGIILVAYLQAILTSDRTLNELNGRIRSVNDLPGKEVVTVKGSTAATFLDSRSIGHRDVERIEDAYPLLRNGQAEAVVFDSPVLIHYVATQGGSKIRLAGGVFRPETYGIAFPTGSALRETVNHSLLELSDDGTYQRIYERWFGTLR